MNVVNWVYYLFLVFAIMLLIRVLIRALCWHRFVQSQNSSMPSNVRVVEDHQGNVFTISDDSTLNAGPPRFADFFYLEPGSEEAARIRAQLEKDDKELPSYDEVIRMCNEQPITPTVNPATPLGMSTTSIATAVTDISLPAPPYTEIDINATTTTTAATSAIAAPSTSRAAASAVVVVVGDATSPASTTA